MGVMIWQIGLSDLFARELGEMPLPVADGEAVVYNDKIYLFGGYSDSLKSSVDWIQEFDPFAPEGRQWRLVGKMNIARSNFLAKLYNDTVYIAGGKIDPAETVVQAMETWSFNENRSELFAEDKELNRIGAAGVVWQNYFIIVGGYYSNTANVIPNYIVAYNLDTDKVDFSLKRGQGPDMYDQVAALVDNRIFVFGGVRNGVSNRIYEIVMNFDQLRPQDIRVRPDLSTSRAGFDAVVAENAVYLIGGYSERDKAITSVDKFIVTSKGFEISKSGSTLIYPRSSLMSAFVNDSIYVFGGYDAREDVVSQVEVFPHEEASTHVEERVTVNQFRLAQNYPNPFNSSTRIKFELPYHESVSLDIFSGTGQLLKNLAQGMFPKGRHEYVWDGRDTAGNPLPSGVYFYKLTSSTFTETKKMLLAQ